MSRLSVLVIVTLLTSVGLPGCGVHATSAVPEVVSATSRADSLLVQQLDAFMQSWIAADSFSGIVMLARDGSPIYLRTAGVADRTSGAPITADTRFNLGSTDKFFTRIAIRQLQEAGKLSTSDLVGRHLPDYPNARVRNEVTIDQLLAMRSGLGDFDTDPDYRNYLAKRLELRTIDDFLALFATDSLRFDPGTGQSYSNAGYVVLGKIIERVSGQSYYDYVRQQVFEPASMDDTGYFTVESRTPNLAIGYTRAVPSGESEAGGVRTSERRPNTGFLPYRGSSAGGGYSTVRDLLNLTRAIFSHRLLSPAYTDSLLGPAFRTTPPDRFEVAGWRGGSEGINSAYLVFSTGHTLIALSNYDPPSTQTVSNKFMREWLPRWLEEVGASSTESGKSPGTLEAG